MKRLLADEGIIRNRMKARSTKLGSTKRSRATERSDRKKPRAPASGGGAGEAVPTATTHPWQCQCRNSAGNFFSADEIYVVCTTGP